ncbi:NFACT family protein [Candidatus Woesearchaeota archaeon]|nr:NFACT family protein [Candidatus Woesearchaeota archaeon]
MPKKNISSWELAALMQELKFLVRGKISQIYHQENEEILLQLHVPGKGKQLLKIVPGKWLCLTSEKEETPTRPSSFCMQLRKYISNAFIKDFSQKDAERVVVFELEKEETYFLIIELFSKGNVVLTDKDWVIITALERQIWKDRVVKPYEKYLFPAGGVNWKTITEREMKQILGKSEKKNVATALATEIGLGGVYAEEVCSRAGIDKNGLPGEMTTEEIKKITKTIHSCLELIEKPKGYIYDDDSTPLPLSGKKENNITSTYNEAISALNPYQKKSPYEQKIQALHRMTESQEEAIKELQQKIEVNTAKGNKIYEHYTALQRLLAIVKEMRKTKEWGEVATELKREKKIKSVDLKNKKIVMEL